MRRRMTGTLAVCLGLLVAAMGTAAGAQTTTTTTTSTSTSSTTSSSTSTTATTTGSTTTTTAPPVVNPCDGQPCTAEPPRAVLSGTHGEVALDRGSYCWRGPDVDANGNIIVGCVDIVASEPDAELVVQAGETLSLRFGSMTPSEVSMQRDETSTSLDAGNPVRFVADLPAGSHVVSFLTRWSQGDASYRVRLVVRATARPAEPKKDVRISLTG